MLKNQNKQQKINKYLPLSKSDTGVNHNKGIRKDGLIMIPSSLSLPSVVRN